jgi:hypothetical protein
MNEIKKEIELLLSRINFDRSDPNLAIKSAENHYVYEGMVKITENAKNEKISSVTIDKEWGRSLTLNVNEIETFLRALGKYIDQKTEMAAKKTDKSAPLTDNNGDIIPENWDKMLDDFENFGKNDEVTNICDGPNGDFGMTTVWAQKYPIKLQAAGFLDGAILQQDDARNFFLETAHSIKPRAETKVGNQTLNASEAKGIFCALAHWVAEKIMQ